MSQTQQIYLGNSGDTPVEQVQLLNYGSEVTEIKLDGVTIWEKPDLDIELTGLTYNSNGTLTINVDFPILINSWKYQIDDGALSNAFSVNAVDVPGSVAGQTYTVTVYGYRDGVLKGAENLDTASVAEQNRRRKTITIPTQLVSNNAQPIILPVKNWGTTSHMKNNDRSYQSCYPNHWEAIGQDVTIPAQLALPGSGSTTIATFYAPTDPGTGHPALTQTEWDAWYAYNLDHGGIAGHYVGGHPHIGINWIYNVGNTTYKNADAQTAALGHRTGNIGPYASGAETFKCGKIGWTRKIGSSPVGFQSAPALATTLVTLQLMPNGTIQSSVPSVFDPTSLNALYTAQ